MSAVGQPVLTFGQKRLDKVYRRRPGAYGIAFDGPDRVLVVKGDRGYFLPGGGVHMGETHEMALYREFGEETGFSLEWHGFLATVRQFHTAGGHGSLEKICSYYLVRIEGLIEGQERTEHEPMWLDTDAAAAAMFQQADRWAIELAARVVAEAMGS